MLKLKWNPHVSIHQFFFVDPLTNQPVDGTNHNPPLSTQLLLVTDFDEESL